MFRLTGAGALAVVLYSPWLLSLPSQLAKLDQAYWIAPPGPADVITTTIAFLAGLPITEQLLPFVLFLSILILVIGLYATVKELRARSSNSYAGLWLLYLSLSPVFLMFLVSLVQPIYIHRAMLPSAGVFTIWLAWIVSHIRFVFLGVRSIPVRAIG